MIDLTSSLQAGLNTNQPWVAAQRSGTLIRQIEAVCQNAMLRIPARWTPDEAWTIIVDGSNRPAACIWRRAPFAYVTANAPPDLRAWLGSWNTVLIEVADWHAPNFTVDLEAMSQFGRWFDWHADPGPSRNLG